jgi:hypothetical protein
VTVLSARALNRALLARQGLLERTATPALEMLERVAGLQAQVPSNPYVALWSRLAGFDPQELSALIESRRAVRAGLMRATVHLVSARDCLAMQPLTQPILMKVFWSPFGMGLADHQVEAVVEAGRALLAAGPLTRAQIGERLAPQFPGAEPASLSAAVTMHVPVVQIPPRGVWGKSGQATWEPTETFLGASPAPPDVDALMLRYLAAFGPATVGDARTWSRLTGLREVVERLRPQLRTFRDGRGRELFDVPGGALPDPDTPAPPRFLPEFDNVLLSHEDRARVMADGAMPYRRGRWIGWLLVDGFLRGYWNLDGDALEIEGFAPRPDDPPGTVEALAAEGERLTAFIRG